MIDLTGEQFGRLTVIEDSGERRVDRRTRKGKAVVKAGAVIWHCRCECGNVVPVLAHNLKSGNTQSCGCFQVDQTVRGRRRQRPLKRCLAVLPAELKLARAVSGVSLERLAATLGLASHATLVYLESGRVKHVHPDTATGIAAALGCRVADFCLAPASCPTSEETP